VHFFPLDLSSFESIDKFNQDFRKKFCTLNILVNNAGILNFEKKVYKTKCGRDQVFMTNFLGPYYLTQLLKDLLSADLKENKVLNVSSKVHLDVKEKLDFSNL
jgi:NAD(P)-dependent dehydrogenase (short-subunit alcohol dehydrogenase family)